MDFSAEHLSPTSSFSWLCFSLLMGSGKHISLQGAPVHAAAHCCGPAGTAPLYYASQWESHRKVSVTRLRHLQPEGSKTLSFCFSTFPDTAHCRGHVPTVRDLRWRITRDAECGETKLDTDTPVSSRPAPVEKLHRVMSYSKPHLSAASVGSCHISFQQLTKYPHRANTHRPRCL